MSGQSSVPSVRASPPTTTRTLPVGETDASIEVTENSTMRIRRAYTTDRGIMIHGTAERVLSSRLAKRYRGKVQLIFTSPPFPLNRKKRYGNLQGDDYVKWLAGFAPVFRDFLKLLPVPAVRCIQQGSPSGSSAMGECGAGESQGCVYAYLVDVSDRKAEGQ